MGGPLQPRLRAGGTDWIRHNILEAESTDSTLQDVLQAIVECRTALEVKINTLSTDLGLLWDDHKRVTERVFTTERDLADAIPTLTLANNRLNTIDNRLKVLESRAEDAENRA
ncbi:hypothetical protein NDU88_007858 [Pleurodeles waltl]|uniref:Tektin n=1 Tax=Pleurodeles waltl TaxID=8319 RepID=A0AAV7VV03_PLEWA|nr:hypothetical protein NDU88_007858 [Pleurodeles waltl]